MSDSEKAKANDKIREKFFPNYPQNITVGDKIIVTQNNANYAI